MRVPLYHDFACSNCRSLKQEVYGLSLEWGNITRNDPYRTILIGNHTKGCTTDLCQQLLPDQGAIEESGFSTL
jgi:hypothetical protein